MEVVLVMYSIVEANRKSGSLLTEVIVPVTTALTQNFTGNSWILSVTKSATCWVEKKESGIGPISSDG